MNALDSVISISQLPSKKMQEGGSASLSDAPPEDINLLPRFEGFEPGPNQFYLREEETVIPSEPNVLEKSLRQRGDVFPFPEIKGPIPSEPGISSLPSMDRATEGTSMGERFFYGPVITPQEVYPRDPDPYFERAPFSYEEYNRGIMGIPNLLQSNYLKPAGILSINKTYDI